MDKCIFCYACGVDGKLPDSCRRADRSEPAEKEETKRILLEAVEVLREYSQNDIHGVSGDFMIEKIERHLEKQCQS